MSTLNYLVRQFVEVRARRFLLEKEAQELKANVEDDLKARILQIMAAQGLKSANVEGLGRVVSKENSHFEIMDMEALALQMFKNFVTAAQSGRPLTDALLLQRRVHAENLSNFIEMEGQPCESFLTSLGVRKVVKNDLSFTKA